MKKWLKRLLVFMLVFTISMSTSMSALAAQLTLPAALKTVDEEAFEGNTALDEVLLPEGVTAIASRAFAESSITSITLPRSLSSIADDAFEGSPNVKAIVKPGSYALDWCKNNKVPYAIDDSDVSSGNVSVSVSADKTSVAMGSSVKLTLSADNGVQTGENNEVRVSYVYLNASNEVVGATNRYYSNLGVYNSVLRCGGATKVLVTVCDYGKCIAGKNPSVEIKLTGGDSYVYYTADIIGTPFPGGKLRVYVTAVNGEKMTTSKKAVLKNKSGEIKVTLGTLSAKNTKIVCDVEIPEDYLDSTGAWMDYDLRLYVSDEKVLQYNSGTARPHSSAYHFTKGEKDNLDFKLIPAEMPYKLSVADKSIATIDSEGNIHALAVGSTTCTMTLASGYTTSFEIVVEDPYEEVETPAATPVIYVLPADETINEGSERDMFHVYSAVADAPMRGEILVRLDFLDEELLLIDSARTSCYVNETAGNGIDPEWEWYADMAEDYRYIDVTLLPPDAEEEFEFETEYELCQPTTARIRVIRRAEQGKPAFSASYSERQVPGATVEYTLTCRTPELLKGVTKDKPIVVKAISPNYNYDVIVDSTDAVFYEGKTVATGSVKLADHLLEGVSIPLYYGNEQVEALDIDTSSAASRYGHNVSMLVGESAKLPLEYDEESVARTKYYIGDEDMISVKNDVVTALKAGETYVEVLVTNSYGYDEWYWFNVMITEPASEEAPVMTMEVNAESVKFGGAVPATVQLSECIYDANGNPKRIEFCIAYCFLDARGNEVADNIRWYYYSADELAAGKKLKLSGWEFYDRGIYDAVSMNISVYYPNYETEFIWDFDDVRIDITDVPSTSELIYGIRDNGESEVQQGGYFEVYVWRTQESVGKDVEVAVVDEDGVVLDSATLYEGDNGSYLSFDTEFIDIGEHEIFLMVDGELIEDAKMTFDVLESRLYLNIDKRISAGSEIWVNYYYGVDNYDCPVTATVSDTTIATVDGDQITFNKSGEVTVTVTCEHGQTSSSKVIVYDPNSTTIPEFYILPDEEGEIEWKEYLDVIIGTSTDLTKINRSTFYVPYRLMFLDDAGEIVYEMENSFYHNLRTAESSDGWNNSTGWRKAMAGNATSVCFELDDSQTGEFTVDPEHSSVTYELTPIAEYPYPVVDYTCTNVIAPGGTVEVTLTCVNPNSLGDGRRVSLLSADNEGVVYDTAVMSKDVPSVTLKYTVPEDFEGEWFAFTWPDGEGMSTTSFDVNIGVVYGFSEGSDRKIDIDDDAYLYLNYDYGVPDMTYTSSDESVVSITRDGGYYVQVTGHKKGSAIITATTPDGASYTARVTVYDYYNRAVPELSLSNTQSVTAYGWTEKVPLNIEADCNAEDFGSFSVGVRIDYLDEDENVVSTQNHYGSLEHSFVLSEDVFAVNGHISKAANAYARGAVAVRYTLIENGSSYTVNADEASVVLPFADPASGDEPITYVAFPERVVAGVPFEANIVCMNPASLDGEVEYSLTGSRMTEIVVRLSAEKPSAGVTITVPEYYSGYSSYTISMNCDDNYVGEEYIQLIRGSLDSFGSALSVGDTRSIIYSLSNAGDFAVEFTSDNTDVAVIDGTTLTAVGSGTAQITMTCGPLVRTVNVRVYDNDDVGESKPVLHVYADEGTAGIKPGSDYYFNVEVVGNYDALGYYANTEYLVEFLNDSNEVVSADVHYNSIYFAQGYADRGRIYVYDDLLKAVMKGATKIRITVDDEYFDLSDDTEAMIIPIMNASEWGGTYFGMDYADVMFPGTEQELTVSMLSVNGSYANKDCTVTFMAYDDDDYFVEDETAVINAENPTCTFSFTIPEDASDLTLTCYYKFEGESYNYNSSSVSPNLLYISRAQEDAALAIGSELYPYYSGNIDDLERSFESSNPDIAAITDEGYVIGVSCGIATITAHIGPFERTFRVRVYDPNVESAVPELYLFNPDPDQEVDDDNDGVIGIGTTTDVSTLGSSCSVYIYQEYLDAEGNVVRGGGSRSYSICYVADEEIVVASDVYSSSANALVDGATHIRYMLVANDGYTIDPERGSVTMRLSDRSYKKYTQIVCNEPSIVYAGEATDVKIKLMSTSEDDADMDFVIKFTAYDAAGNYFFNEEEKTINTANPVAVYTIPAVANNVSSLSYRYEVYRSGYDYSMLSDSNSMYVLRVDRAQGDMVLGIGNSSSASYSGNGLSSVTKKYESSNPAVATVDSSGKVRAQSVGCAVITVYIGKLEYSFNVRVYDQNQSYDTPDIYLVDCKEGDMLNGSGYIDIRFGTTTDLTQIGSYSYAYYDYEYLDADGNMIGTRYKNKSIQVVFASNETKASASLEGYINAVAAGAVQVRVMMHDDPSDSTVIPIQDCSEWPNTRFGLGAPTVCYENETVSLNVKWLSAAASDAGKNAFCTLYVRDQNTNDYLVNYEVREINMSNPVASYSFKVPEDCGSLYVYYSITYEGNSSSSASSYSYIYPIALSSQPSDKVVKVGSAINVGISVKNSSYVSASYESSDESVVTVNENGVLTGVSCGTAVVTGHFGELDVAVKVRVYDSSSIASTKLSLSVPEGVTEQSWDLVGQLLFTADQAVENIPSINNVNVYARYYDAEGNQVDSESKYLYFNFVDSNVVTVPYQSARAVKNLIEKGVVRVEYYLGSVSGSYVNYNSEARTVSLPMQSLADYNDPILTADGLSSSNWNNIDQYTVNITAHNTEYVKPVSVYAYTNVGADKVVLGTLEFTPSEDGAAAEMIVGVPAGVSLSASTMYVMYVDENGEEMLLASYSISVRMVNLVTKLADLQSEHNYQNSMDATWIYTVEGATSLSVTFDSRSQTETSWDKVYYGDRSCFENSSYPSYLTGSIGAAIIEVEGDTLAIYMHSDSSVNGWGFAIAQIVATMADGSTVTITE